MKKYFELKEGDATEFWEISLKDSVINTRSGLIMTDGKFISQKFISSKSALKCYNKLIKEKISLGFVDPDVFEQKNVSGVYHKLARSYNLYFPILAIGLERRIRSMTRDALELKPGQVVLDVGCGSGSNFQYIINEIGPTGRIIGVDYSPAMLKQAQKLVKRKRWKNVELIECDAAKLDLGHRVDAAVSTLAMAVIPDHREALKRMAAHVHPGGRVVVAECKLSDTVPGLNRIARKVSRFLAADINRQAWKDMADFVDDFTCVDAGPIGLYFIASGNAR